MAVQSGIGVERAGVRVWSRGSWSQGLKWRRRRGKRAASVGSERSSHCFSLPLWWVHLVTRVRFVCVNRAMTTHHFLVLVLVPLWYPHHFHHLSTHLHTHLSTHLNMHPSYITMSALLEHIYLQPPVLSGNAVLVAPPLSSH